MFGSALGDRFGRRRLFGVGIGIFTLASAAAALAPGIDALIAARAVQGVGAAIMMPLTLTLLTAAVPVERRGMAFGIWGAVDGLAVATGPLIGGALTEHASWQWIFWLNVPLGLVLLPLAHLRLKESHGSNARLDIVGTVLASTALFGIISDRVGGRPVVALGLALQAVGIGLFALVITPDGSYVAQLPALIVSGIGMAMYFAPAANLVMASVRPQAQGIASGANNALRELGGALGIAILATVFSAQGGYKSAAAFTDGLTPALWVGAGAVALGSVATLLVPGRSRSAAPGQDPDAEPGSVPGRIPETVA